MNNFRLKNELFAVPEENIHLTILFILSLKELLWIKCQLYIQGNYGPLNDWNRCYEIIMVIIYRIEHVAALKRYFQQKRNTIYIYILSCIYTSENSATLMKGNGVLPNRSRYGKVQPCFLDRLHCRVHNSIANLCPRLAKVNTPNRDYHREFLFRLPFDRSIRWTETTGYAADIDYTIPCGFTQWISYID